MNTCYRFVLALLVSGGIALAVPQQISYQGHLTLTDQTPLDTVIAMNFRLYADSSGGMPLWTETRPAVVVTGGSFVVRLGHITSLPDSILNRAQVWLAVAVGADTEMAPRSQLLSAPYAYRVVTVDGASGGALSGKLNVGSNNSNAGDFANVFGEFNSATGSHAVASGGLFNFALGNRSTTGGGQSNSTLGDWAVVSGGSQNAASTNYSVISGGLSNTASGNDAAISGGEQNSASGAYAAISGGRQNLSSGLAAAVSGGEYNKARGDYSVVGGGGGPAAGDSNTALGVNSVVGGGNRNSAIGELSTIAGGHANTAMSYYTTISGGYLNSAQGNYATVAGGYDNVASGGQSIVAGGSDNSTGDFCATVSGGCSNTATGYASTVPGGSGNSAGGDYGLAAGHNAHADFNGCFVWADANTADFSAPVANRFHVRASGGVAFYSSADLSNGVFLFPNDGAWSGFCDVNKKRLHGTVNTSDVLEKVSALPLYRWSYKSQDESIQHIGPTAQDFYATFGLGNSDTTISTLDPDGIALAAIQELAKRLEVIERRLADSEKENMRLHTLLDDHTMNTLRTPYSMKEN